MQANEWKILGYDKSIEVMFQFLLEVQRISHFKIVAFRFINRGKILSNGS